MRRTLLTLWLLLALPLCVPAISCATVNEVAASNRYVASGSNAIFAYTFKLLANTDIEVIQNGTTKTLTTHYTVSGVGSSGGGNVTFVTTPAANDTITLLRKQPVQQTSTYVPNEPFPSTRIEKDFDKQAMIDQQQTEVSVRALKLAKSSTKTNLSVPDPESGKLMRWKSDLTGLENIALADLGTASLVIPPGSPDGTLRVDSGAVSAATVRPESYTEAALPATCTDGQLVVVSTVTRGLRRCKTNQWLPETHVSPREWGAVFDGVTNDATALNQMITDIPAYTVVEWPNATAKINSTITWAKSMRWVGSQETDPETASGGSRILCAAGITCITANPAFSNLIVQAERLVIDGGAIGFDFQASAQYLSRTSHLDVVLLNQTDTAIKNVTGMIGTYHRLKIAGAGSYGIWSQGNNLVNATQWDVRITDKTTYAIYLEETNAVSPTSMVTIDGIIESNPGGGLYLKTIKAQGTLWFEANGTVGGAADIELDSGASEVTVLHLIGGYFSAPGAAQSNRRIKVLQTHVRLVLNHTTFTGTPTIDVNSKTTGVSLIEYMVGVAPTYLNNTVSPTRINPAFTDTILGAYGTISGGLYANEDMTLQGTTHATRTTSLVTLQPNGGDIVLGGSGNAEALVTQLGTRVGSDVAYSVQNGDNTNAASGASVEVKVAGTSAGDPCHYVTIQGVTSWGMCLDNSDSDKFKIGPGAAGAAPILILESGGNATIPNALLANTIAVGTGTTLTKVVVYTPSLTPGASGAAIGAYEEEFTVSGITTADKVIVNGPTPTALCPLVGARASDTDKIKLQFATLTALACTPAAGTYTITAIRS